MLKHPHSLRSAELRANQAPHPLRPVGARSTCRRVSVERGDLVLYLRVIGGMGIQYPGRSLTPGIKMLDSILYRDDFLFRISCLLILIASLVSGSVSVSADGEGGHTGIRKTVVLTEGARLFAVGHEIVDSVTFEWSEGDTLRANGIALRPAPARPRTVIPDDKLMRNREFLSSGGAAYIAGPNELAKAAVQLADLERGIAGGSPIPTVALKEIQSVRECVQPGAIAGG